jgi:hypothetical protein
LQRRLARQRDVTQLLEPGSQVGKQKNSFGKNAMLNPLAGITSLRGFGRTVVPPSGGLESPETA